MISKFKVQIILTLGSRLGIRIIFSIQIFCFSLFFNNPLRAAEDCSGYLQSVKILGTDFENLGEFKERVRTENNYNQVRNISEVIRVNPALGMIFEKAEAGALVMDLGAGVGATVVSAAYSTEAMSLPLSYGSWVRDPITPEDAALMTKFKFLGITATDGSRIRVPAMDPNGKYRILHSRVFEEIPNEELEETVRSLNGDVRKRIIAFSLLGVLEYTPTPDLALEKLFQIFLPGDMLILRDNPRTLVQTENGALISLAHYAELCGFERKTVQGGSLLKKTSNSYRRIPLTLLAGNYEFPPYYLFRMDRQPFSSDEKRQLDVAALKLSANRDHFDFAMGVIPGWVQLGETLGTFGYADLQSGDSRWQNEEYINYFAERLQGFDKQSVASVFPGEISQTFSGWASIQKNDLAVEFFDSHRDFFRFDLDFADFFEGLRDILTGDLQSRPVANIENQIREYALQKGPPPKPENMGEFLYSILCPKELHLLRDDRYLPLEKISRNQALNALNRAWIYSHSARQWMNSKKLKCPDSRDSI